jgi:transcriptional regulator with XRE-family HTH domain
VKRISLRTARKAKKLTQAQLAERLGRVQSYVSKLERGDRTDITLDEVSELGKVLGVEPWALTFPAPNEVSR